MHFGLSMGLRQIDRDFLVSFSEKTMAVAPRTYPNGDVLYRSTSEVMFGTRQPACGRTPWTFTQDSRDLRFVRGGPCGLDPPRECRSFA